MAVSILYEAFRLCDCKVLCGIPEPLVVSILYEAFRLCDCKVLCGIPEPLVVSILYEAFRLCDKTEIGYDGQYFFEFQSSTRHSGFATRRVEGGL